jgi:DNA-directed RNA polymerase specialized sigma24 family protein
MAGGLVSLVRRAQQGDAAALAALLERAGPALLRFCRRLVPEAGAAQDLAQEALLRAHGALPRLGEPALPLVARPLAIVIDPGELREGGP